MCDEMKLRGRANKYGGGGKQVPLNIKSIGLWVDSTH